MTSGAVSTGRGPDERAAAVAEVFRSLSSPVRVAVIDHLSRTPACVHELVDLLDLPQPLLSQHLRVLRAARLVTATRRGREVTYELADEHVAHIVADALTHAAEVGQDLPVAPAS